MNYLDSKLHSPKYWQLAERFRAQLKDGTLKPGDRLPTLNEMRDDHNISRTTVEKAYGLLERDGLIERLHGSGVFVSQPRRRSTHGVIGLSGFGFSFNGNSSYWAQLLGGIHEAAAREEMQLLILNPASHQGWEKADGLLICGWDDRRQLPSFPYGLPLVSLLTLVPGVASVTADDELGAHEATKRLIQLGHRRIAYLHGHAVENSVAWNRLLGYRTALQEAGISPQAQWTRCLHGHYYFDTEFTSEAFKNVQHWLKSDWSTLGCTALVCHNDQASWGAVQAFNEAGIRVPQDVSIVGFDGTEYCDLVTPKLSSIELPLREIGVAGVELLLKQIKADEISEEHRVLPIQLRERESTAVPSHYI